MKRIVLVLALAAAAAMPAAASANVMFGLSTESPQTFRTVQSQMPVQLWSPFVGWKGANGFETVTRQAASFHVKPFISWETWDARTRVAGGRNPKSTPGLWNTSIADGNQDKYLAEQVKAAKAYRKVIYVRFDHEFNGNWYPWSGNAKGYVKMWRHVVNAFHKHGAKNVKFIWSPNLNTYESDAVFDKRVATYWPGSKYVDIIGATVTRVQVQGGTLDPNDPNNGYYQGPSWFFQRLDRLYKYRAGAHPKPFWITEALVDLEEMPAWMPPFRAEVNARPWIKAVNWLSTTGPQTPSFGSMNWSLANQPLARQYLTF